MGVTLYFSNQLMPLAEKLRDNLVPEDAGGSLLDAPVVIVPNMNLSKWIKLTLARQCGIFMNVEFQYLESGLWRMLRSLANPADTEPELLDRDNLRILLFFILMSGDSGTPDLAVADRYLRRDRVTQSELEIRCWQLSGELARLFQEYEYHRSEMIHDWRQDAPLEEPMERCQKRLYRNAMSLKSQLGRSIGRPFYSMAEHTDVILGGIAKNPCQESVREQVHFFGLSQISPFHLQLLSRLQAYFDIRIYSLNPSREYWEDIQTPFEKKWIQRRSVHSMALEEGEIKTGELFRSPDHPLLSAWGKPGRENIRLLCQLTGYDFEAGFAEPQQLDTVLAAVQGSLLTLDTAAAMAERLPQDTSLQVVACPGIRREVETVYDSIVHNLESDARLCMTDIAVLVPDMSRYKPVVDSVFNRQPRRIAYNLVDSAARTESVFAQAVQAFIELARGAFTRKQVFDLLRNPCVMKKWRYGRDDLSIWVEWADALGIFRGFENPMFTDEHGPQVRAVFMEAGVGAAAVVPHHDPGQPCR